MSTNRHGRHPITRLTVHVVWGTTYCSHVVNGDIQTRCRVVLTHICDAEDMRMLKGVMSKDHVHMLIDYPPSTSGSDRVQRLKGRTSRILQQAFPEVRKRSWGKHCWAMGYGAWSFGNVTDDRVAEYGEHHRHPSNHPIDPLLVE